MKKFLYRINTICDKYQPLLQTSGIIVGLYLIFLTYSSVKISNDQLLISSEQLKISQNQEIQKQMPIWQFDVNDSLSFATLSPFSPDVKLEQATAYFSNNQFFDNSKRLKIDQPNFNLNLKQFKSFTEKMVLKNTKYSDSTLSVAMRNDFPVGIEINYVQFGELKSINAIFVIQYTSVRTSEKYVHVKVDGVKFNRYLYKGENLMDELDKSNIIKY